MDWIEFEHEVQHLVEAFGYMASTTLPSGDYGVDVIAESHNRKVVIQCKLYGKGNVGGDAMMKLVGSQHYFNATDAICFTTSKFTKQAKEIAVTKNIKLVDGDMLLLLCKERSVTIPSLTVLEHTSGDVFNILGPNVYIGRHSDNHIIIDSPHVSRRHAHLHRNGLVLSIADNGSTNGTRINGKVSAGSVTLTYGDEISLGGIGFVVRMETPSGKLL